MHALMQSTSNPMVIDTNKVVHNNIILTFADHVFVLSLINYKVYTNCVFTYTQ